MSNPIPLTDPAGVVRAVLNMLSLRAMVAAERLAAAIGRRLNVRNDNSLYPVEDVWCIGCDGALYYRDSRGGICTGYRCEPLRWGRWVVASERWYDGCGTTYVLRADREMHAAEAHAMEREYRDSGSWGL